MAENDVTSLRHVLLSGADVNAGDLDGHTALMVACSIGNIPFIKLLLRHGANVNARSLTGHTALDFADVSLNVLHARPCSHHNFSRTTPILWCF